MHIIAHSVTWLTIMIFGKIDTRIVLKLYSTYFKLNNYIIYMPMVLGCLVL